MNDVVIKAENLGKKYIIGHQAERGGYTALRDVLMQNARTLWNKTKDLATGKPIIQGDTMEEVWALKDVSFEIKRGEAVGIIGRNGAGKSTLLKILSRITEPSTGRVTIKGRVASLLEVGTGFHPELSGRENIYLNGTILGMTRVEIKRKFDEIVAFAEVEKYLDTPVKRYSSGMYVRLAFAVAAHLEPEILVVDEVLAVGDVQFQKKCLGKMDEIGKEGRTILFVSHNLGAISQLCVKAILLETGTMIQFSAVDLCIARYMAIGQQGATDLSIVRKVQPNKKLVIERLRLVSETGDENGVVNNKLPAELEVTFWIETPGSSYAIAAEISSSTKGVLLATSTLDSRPLVELGNFDQRGRYTASLVLPMIWLMAGNYSIRVAAAIPCVEELDIFPNEINFSVNDNSSPIAVLGEGRRGIIAPRLQWRIKSYC
jgi:lipopolysaccharide transport system ATP-binding protein